MAQTGRLDAPRDALMTELGRLVWAFQFIEQELTRALSTTVSPGDHLLGRGLAEELSFKGKVSALDWAYGLWLQPEDYEKWMDLRTRVRFAEDRRNTLLHSLWVSFGDGTFLRVKHRRGARGLTKRGPSPSVGPEQVERVVQDLCGTLGDLHEFVTRVERKQTDTIPGIRVRRGPKGVVLGHGGYHAETSRRRSARTE